MTNRKQNQTVPSRGKKAAKTPDKKRAVHFEPSQEQRKIVMLMSATGATQEQMRANITNPATGKPINEHDFRAVFREELDNSLAKLNAMVAGNLYAIATSSTHKAAATAAIFWLKTRAGWREPENWMAEQRRVAFEAEMQKGDEVMRVTLVFDEENQRAVEASDDADRPD